MHERLAGRALAWWTAAFVLHRLVVLRSGFDGLFYWEEAYRLLVAEAIWNGWRWPLLDLQADPYAGGSLVIALLAVPGVALAGPSLLGLKLVALAWSTVGFVVWTHLIDARWGRRAGSAFAFLFVFAPPLFVLYNLIAMGSHAEVATLVGVQLLLGYRVLYDGQRSALPVTAWAAVAGFGTWFTYDSVVAFAVCVALGVLGGMLPRRTWPLIVCGFLVGFFPWVLTNVESGGRGLDVIMRTFLLDAPAGRRSLGATLEYLGYLLQTGIPLGLRFADVVAPLTGAAPRRLLLPHVYFALYALAVAALLATGAARLRRGVRAWLATTPELPLVVLFPALIAILAISDHVFLEAPRAPFFSFRLLVPFLPAVFAVLAIAVARLQRPLRWAALAVLGLIGCAGTASLVNTGAADLPRRLAEARVLGAEAAGHLLYYKHGRDMALLAERIGAMPSELQGPAWEGVGFSLAYHFPDDRPLEDFVRLLDAVPRAFGENARRGSLLALGAGMEQVEARPPSRRTRELATAVAALDPPKPDQ